MDDMKVILGEVKHINTRLGNMEGLIRKLVIELNPNELRIHLTKALIPILIEKLNKSDFLGTIDSSKTELDLSVAEIREGIMVFNALVQSFRESIKDLAGMLIEKIEENLTK